MGNEKWAILTSQIVWNEHKQTWSMIINPMHQSLHTANCNFPVPTSYGLRSSDAHMSYRYVYIWHEIGILRVTTQDLESVICTVFSTRLCYQTQNASTYTCTGQIIRNSICGWRLKPRFRKTVWTWHGQYPSSKDKTGDEAARSNHYDIQLWINYGL